MNNNKFSSENPAVYPGVAVFARPFLLRPHQPASSALPELLNRLDHCIRPRLEWLR